MSAKGRFAKNKDDGVTLEHFDSVIWLGDMNYRVAATDSDVVKELIESDMWDTLKANDQLDIEKKLKRVSIILMLEQEIFMKVRRNYIVIILC